SGAALALRSEGRVATRPSGRCRARGRVSGAGGPHDRRGRSRHELQFLWATFGGGLDVLLERLHVGGDVAAGEEVEEKGEGAALVVVGVPVHGLRGGGGRRGGV